MKKCISELNLSSLEEIVAEVCSQSTKSSRQQAIAKFSPS